VVDKEQILYDVFYFCLLTICFFLNFQAKKFVESAPIVVKGDLLKDEADALVKALENVGGKAIVE
jgi:hypothetical protein